MKPGGRVIPILSGARVSERLLYLESRVARCELQRVEESHAAAPAPLCKA